MSPSVERVKVHFVSDGTRCAAWHYPGTNGGCVIMSGGLAVTKEPGTDRFAQRFHEAGFSVLAFDYRRFGESDGRPRQIVRFTEQRADWQAAIEFARTLPEVDPRKLAIWGFSLSSGHVFPVAARNPQLAAAIAHSPLVDGPAAIPNAMRHQKPLASLRFSARAIVDTVGGRLGRDALLVPLAGEPGTITSLTTPDATKGADALNPGNQYPEWQQAVAASSAARVAFYRPGRHAARVQVPLLVVAYEDDGVAPPG
ncbi:MAG TPA: alpha/beta fold hydrolase, partial [Baekduia sp.]|nr:alpha/beta fold hydrolase [Baekduia sp.]